MSSIFSKVLALLFVFAIGIYLISEMKGNKYRGENVGVYGQGENDKKNPWEICLPRMMFTFDGGYYDNGHREYPVKLVNKYHIYNTNNNDYEGTFKTMTYNEDTKKCTGQIEFRAKGRYQATFSSETCIEFKTLQRHFITTIKLSDSKSAHDKYC